MGIISIIKSWEPVQALLLVVEKASIYLQRHILGQEDTYIFQMGVHE